MVDVAAKATVEDEDTDFSPDKRDIKALEIDKKKTFDSVQTQNP